MTEEQWLKKVDELSFALGFWSVDKNCTITWQDQILMQNVLRNNIPFTEDEETDNASTSE